MIIKIYLLVSNNVPIARGYRFTSFGLTIKRDEFINQQHFLNLLLLFYAPRGSIFRSSDILMPTVCYDIYPV